MRGRSEEGNERRGERKSNKKNKKSKTERKKLLFWNIAGIGNKDKDKLGNM